MKNGLVRAIGAGLAISLGMYMYGYSGVKNLFGLGIAAVYLCGFSLFTTYLPVALITRRNDENLIRDCFTVLLGNLIGTTASFMFFNYIVKINPLPFIAMAEAKAAQSAFHLILNGIGVGIIIGTAAILARRRPEDKNTNVVIYYILVTAFVVMSGEHIIANAFTVLFAPHTIGKILVCSLVGNIIGSFLIAETQRG